MNNLKALLLHEATHSLLHGNIKSYFVITNTELKNILGEKYIEVVYLASTIIKDLEVHEFLVHHGYKNEVEQYYTYFSRDLYDLSCDSIKGLLDFAKLVSPCIFVDCNPDPLHVLIEHCKMKYPKVITILQRVNELKSDIGVKANLLIKDLLNP